MSAKFHEGGGVQNNFNLQSIMSLQKNTQFKVTKCCAHSTNDQKTKGQPKDSQRYSQIWLCKRGSSQLLGYSKTKDGPTFFYYLLQ